VTGDLRPLPRPAETSVARDCRIEYVGTVSQPPEKIHSTATAEPEGGLRQGHTYNDGKATWYTKDVSHEPIEPWKLLTVA
jgi:hypothetical protein